MLTLLWIVSIVLLLVPMIVMFAIVSRDEKGNYINRKRYASIEWFGVLIVACFVLSYAWVIFFLIEYINSGFDPYYMRAGLFWWPGLIIWAVVAVVALLVPVFYLRNTRIEGKELNMWEHLTARKEVLFPWEYNPVATNLAWLYFVLALVAMGIGLYFVTLFFAFDRLKTIILLVGLMLIGLYFGYLLLKPVKK